MYKSPVHGLCVQIMRFEIIYILAVLLLSEVARTDGSVCEAGTREKQYDPPSRLRCGGTCGCVPEGGSIGYLQSHADFTYDKSDTYKNNDDCWWIASGSASLYVTFFHYEFEAGADSCKKLVEDGPLIYHFGDIWNIVLRYSGEHVCQTTNAERTYQSMYLRWYAL